MIFPRKWILKRPGIVIPVFFLFLVQVKCPGQVYWQEAASAALGGCFVTRQGYSCANQNPAGLAFIEQSTISLQHSRPYWINELGTSAISAQFLMGTGAFGFSLAAQGLRGFTKSSLWLSYGLRLHPGVSAGVGLHFWNSALFEKLVYAPGCSFAIGLQITMNEQWKLGARLFHPAGWSSCPKRPFQNQMALASGFAFSFLQTGILYAELNAEPETGIVLCGGLEWSFSRHTVLRTGICHKPLGFSWGLSLIFTRWVAELSFLYRPDTGLSPHTSLTHVW